MVDLTKKAWAALRTHSVSLWRTYATNCEFVEVRMKHTHQLPDRLHFTDLAHEAVWIADEQTRLDTEHAQALSRLGFGFSGGRFLVQTH